MCCNITGESYVHAFRVRYIIYVCVHIYTHKNIYSMGEGEESIHTLGVHGVSDFSVGCLANVWRQLHYIICYMFAIVFLHQAHLQQIISVCQSN